MKGKDFLTIADLLPKEVEHLLNQAHVLKNGVRPRLLEGKIIALVFEKPSLRTRVSFEVGIRQMGGDTIYLSQQDIGLGSREPVEDSARVLDRLVDGVVARVFSHRNLEIMAENTSIPVINALSDLAHPCQAIGDMLTILEHKSRLKGLTISYIGDGNNIAGSLALACASVGANFTIASPPQYRIPDVVWEEALSRAKITDSLIQWKENAVDAVANADVVYTDVWISMGQEIEKEQRLRNFDNYRVSEDLVEGAKPDFLFMHDMPAHRGEEVTRGMLDHPRSVVFHQAENRLHAQNAILKELFKDF